MELHRGLKYRIYPSPEQEARLRRWEGSLRFLWNLAHEQRLAGLQRLRGEKVFPSFFSQDKELTDLRAEVDWIEDVPRDIQQATLRNLDAAWSDFFRKSKGKPRFKSKGHDAMSMTEAGRKAWSIKLHHGQWTLRFPKIGNIPVVLHRPIEGKATSATISRDGKAWFVSIHVSEDVDIVSDPSRPAVGIDRGVANVLADSTGHLEPRPAFLDKGEVKLARAHRSVSRKQKGSKNKAKARESLVRVHQKIRWQMDALLHRLAHHYAKNHSVVVLEDLNIRGMTASAKGTVEEPGRNVAQKAGLNRKILQANWGRFRVLLEQKALRYGTVVMTVPAAYTSQTCASCGHVDADSRKSQSVFRCVACGHEDHADINAAKVILSRRTGGDEVCGGDGVARPTKQKPKTVRSRTPRKVGAKSSGLQAGDGLPRNVEQLLLLEVRLSDLDVADLPEVGLGQVIQQGRGLEREQGYWLLHPSTLGPARPPLQQLP